MFELADYLVGIYKVEDCTRSLTIQNCDKQRVLNIGEKEGEKENQNNFSLLSPPLSKHNQASFTPNRDVSVAMDVSIAPVNSPVISGTINSSVSEV